MYGESIVKGTAHFAAILAGNSKYEKNFKNIVPIFLTEDNILKESGTTLITEISKIFTTDQDD